MSSLMTFGLVFQFWHQFLGMPFFDWKDVFKMGKWARGLKKLTGVQSINNNKDLPRLPRTNWNSPGIMRVHHGSIRMIRTQEMNPGPTRDQQNWTGITKTQRLIRTEQDSQSGLITYHQNLPGLTDCIMNHQNIPGHIHHTHIYKKKYNTS